MIGFVALLAVVKVGIIGLDTSHVTAFTKLINVEKADFAADFKVTSAYQWGSKDIVSATNRYPKYIAEMKGMGVEIMPTIESLIDSVDCVCLETNDGREHCWQAEKVFAAGKPVFIDKPLAHNLTDAIKIYRAGRTYGARYFSSSVLRFSPVAKAARAGEYGRIRGAAILAPSPEEVQGTHNYYSWYGIHGFEPLVAIMGPGVERVSCFRSATDDIINATWADGRMGQLHLCRDKWSCTGYIYPDKPIAKNQPVILYDGYPGYQAILKEILLFFKTGTPPVLPEETLEIAAFMEAAEMSAKKGGAPVTLDEAYAACGGNPNPKLKPFTVAETACSVQREPLVKPFGFKGGHLSELWIVSASLNGSVGQGLQSSLWSDAKVFSSNSEDDANAIMYDMTKKALALCRGRTFASPMEMTDWLFHQVWAYGKERSGNPALRATYALNALVAVDNAAWKLYAKVNGVESFDALIPANCRVGVPAHHSACATIPLLSYGVTTDEIRKLADEGYFFFKIKIGHAGTQEEMLAWDMNRISEIHAALKDVKTPHTADGRVRYYFDANGRYEKKETLLKFINHLKAIGAYDQTAILEEPFDEAAVIDVNDVPLRLAADESAHTVEDAIRLMDRGFKAMALKPIAKTMSVSLKIAAAAAKRGVPCFCADLTVPPVMVEWNRAVAARLPSFPGLAGLGLVESNGAQNYRNWEKLRESLTYPEASWSHSENGIFACPPDYYRVSGGMLK